MSRFLSHINLYEDNSFHKLSDRTMLYLVKIEYFYELLAVELFKVHFVSWKGTLVPKGFWNEKADLLFAFMIKIEFVRIKNLSRSQVLDFWKKYLISFKSCIPGRFLREPVSVLRFVKKLSNGMGDKFGVNPRLILAVFFTSLWNKGN